MFKKKKNSKNRFYKLYQAELSWENLKSLENWRKVERS